jgi:hypothetical protein
MPLPLFDALPSSIVAVFGCVTFVVVPDTVCEKLVELEDELLELLEDELDEELLDEELLDEELLDEELLELSPGPQTMMWLICLSPPGPPGSNVLLPFESAQTLSPADGLSPKIVSALGSSPALEPALTMTVS